MVSLVPKYLFSWWVGVKIEGLWTEMGGDSEQGITVGWWETRERLRQDREKTKALLDLTLSH